MRFWVYNGITQRESPGALVYTSPLETYPLEGSRRSESIWGLTRPQQIAFSQSYVYFEDRT